MNTVAKIMSVLKQKGSAQTRKTFKRHGAPDSMFGVKVGDLKPLAKQIKGQQELALRLYETGNSDAMYLAGMVADGAQMTKKQLDQWAKSATWYMLSEYTVPGVVCEHPSARDLAIKWIKSKTEKIAATGWSTYSGILATREDNELDLKEIRQLLTTVKTGIKTAPNRVKYNMNGFVISVGTYVKPLLKLAYMTAQNIGAVDCDLGDTACKVPLAFEYIKKVESRGAVGKKRKTIKC